MDTESVLTGIADDGLRAVVERDVRGRDIGKAWAAA